MPKQLEMTFWKVYLGLKFLLRGSTNKYVRQILFDGKQEIMGARIRTYLLERSRIVFQPLRPT